MMKNINRILWVLISAVFITGCRTTTVSDIEVRGRTAGWNGDEYVRLDSGYIEGRADIMETWSWKGIPYAKPPVGQLRWKAPRTPDAWDDVKLTVEFASQASQLSPIFTGISGSEDCLYLNIWRPDTSEEDLPVYVWIHGGGNSIGSPALEDYHGHALASRLNAVFISVNYRLGPLGWFRHPVLKTENALDDSGNYGLLDIISALRWIQRNIESFGGDPGNVTLSGESAGANNTLALLLSPEAGGLFHKAIVQSGYKRSVSINRAETQAGELIEYLLSRRGKDSSVMTRTEIRDILYQSSPSELFKFYNAGSTGMIDHLYHIEDGAVFPENGYQGFVSGDYVNKLPVIIGSNNDEMKLFLFFDSSIPWDSELYELTAEIGSLRFKEGGVDSIASAVSRIPGSPPVYAYRFDWGSPDEAGRSPLPGDWGRRLGAIHTLEIPFFLGTDSINGPIFTAMLFNRKNLENRRLLSGAMMDYTSNFIRTGDPNEGRETALNWPEWDQTNNYIVFNTDEEGLLISTDDRIITAAERLRELKLQLSPELYAQLLKKINR